MISKSDSLIKINLSDFDLSSRVWIYRANLPISDEVGQNVQNELNAFAKSWTSHGHHLIAKMQLIFGQFVLCILNKDQSASGCSIDSKVHFFQYLGNKYNIDFFERMYFDFYVNGKIESYHKDDVPQLIDSGQLSSNSLVFNHLVKNKEEFMQNWIIPYSQSWHSRI